MNTNIGQHRRKGASSSRWAPRVLSVAGLLILASLLFSRSCPSCADATALGDANGAESSSSALVDATGAVKRMAAYIKANRAMFSQKADFVHMEGLGEALYKAGLCREDNAVLVGGVNQGQATSHLLKLCPDITLFGFEINDAELSKAKKRLEQFPNVHIYQMGMGDSHDVLKYKPMGGGTGFFVPSAGERFYKENADFKEAPVVPLTSFFRDQEANYQNGNVPKLLYSLIDVEGFESCVIHGMGLQHESNRKRFAVFQYELGGTWATRDPRHPKGSMSQYETAVYLQNRGYELYLIGQTELLRVLPEIFTGNNVAMENEGYGSFIQGNLLAFHPEHAEPAITNFVRSRQKVVHAA